MLLTASIYPISVARKLTALSERQIRYYEQLGLISPARSAGKRNSNGISQEWKVNSSVRWLLEFRK